MYQRIRDLREDADLRQQDMAEYLQCTQVCYSYYESGKRDIPTDVLIRIARYYDVSVDYLLGLTDRRAGKFLLLLTEPNSALIGKSTHQSFAKRGTATG